tara:strand:+ start:6171 stop:6446 length:276 start_codon:yes stop_codon:yes gene_type:complete
MKLSPDDLADNNEPKVLKIQDIDTWTYNELEDYFISGKCADEHLDIVIKEMFKYLLEQPLTIKLLNLAYLVRAERMRKQVIRFNHKTRRFS